MIVAGAWIVLLGTGLIVVSLIFGAFRLQNRLLLRRLRAARRLDCGALLNGGRLTRSVLLTGTTAPGPAGLLRSLAYDTPSVWFRTDVIGVYDDSAPSDEQRSQSRTLVKRSAGGPIGITDPTGTVLLDLKLILSPRGKTAIVRRRGEEASLSLAHRADEAGPGMARLEKAGLLPASAYGLLLARRADLREELIEPGQPVSVLARPRRDRAATVLLGRPGGLSATGPDVWIESLQATVASDAMMLKLLPIGLAVAAAGTAVIAVGVYSA
ncbi:MAG: hypothetical protein ACQSGP_31400 [Frankia sp.]